MSAPTTNPQRACGRGMVDDPHRTRFLRQFHKNLTPFYSLDQHREAR
jgi:hypothetical protein